MDKANNYPTVKEISDKKTLQFFKEFNISDQSLNYFETN